MSRLLILGGSPFQVPAIPRAIRLEEGDAVFFRDDLLLHGRESFSADAFGDRRLWKGGLRA